MASATAHKAGRRVFCGSPRHVVIHADAVRALLARRQGEGELESGGILLGHVYPTRDEVLQITTPTCYDTRGPSTFVRSRIPAQRRIDCAWHHSNGTVIYLGEWHTHSEVRPHPSKADRAMIARQLRRTVMEIDHLYLLIVGREGDIWVGRCDGSGLQEMLVTE